MRELCNVVSKEVVKNKKFKNNKYERVFDLEKEFPMRIFQFS